MPIPMPPMMRAATRKVNDGVSAQPTAEAVKSTAEMSIVGRRPSLSLIMPAMATPKMLPMSAQPTYQPSI